MVDVTYMRPFYFDPAYVTPLNIMEEIIVQHDFSNPYGKKASSVAHLLKPGNKTLKN